MKVKILQTKAPKDTDKDKIRKKTEKLKVRLAELTHTLNAEKKHSVLVVFQGMDSSGKDGVTRRVFGACSPVLLNSFSFKKPSDEEFAHDFLWRVHKLTPAKGMVHIFNRSHYEDVLIQRVHGWINEKQVKMRMDRINAFETLLKEDNNTTIIKCFLNISYDRQGEKLQERIDLPEKNWKHNSGDWEQRKHWKKYMKCYEDVLNKCNDIPWNVIPADQRWYRDYCVAKIAVETLEKLKMKMPVLSKEELSKESK